MFKRFFIKLLAAIWGAVVLVSGLENDFVGCFQQTSATDPVSLPKDLPFSASQNGTLFPQGIVPFKQCTQVCKSLFFRYAGIQNGQFCNCGSFSGSHGSGQCNVSCSDDVKLFCGAPDANSVYETGILVPGPPQSLALTGRSDKDLRISWEHPLASNGLISEYQIQASPSGTQWPGSVTQALPMEWSFSNVTRADLLGLVPGAHYNISVRAKTNEGYGVPVVGSYSTEIGDPQVPKAPRVVQTGPGQVTIEIKPVTAINGPITAYHIIVVNEGVASLANVDYGNLKSWSEAKADGLPYYIAAEFHSNNLPNEFVVGDGNTYQGFHNPPLPEDHEVVFVLGVSCNYEGVSKHAFSPSSTPSRNEATEESPVRIEDTANADLPVDIQPEDDPETIEAIRRRYEPTTQRTASRKRGRPYLGPTPPLVIGLSAAIGVIASLLILSIIIYASLRYRTFLKKRRRSADRQQLTLQQGSTFELSNGFTHPAYLMGVEEMPSDYYDSLKERVWSIPANCVQFEGDVLGQGKFGAVKKGHVTRGESRVAVALYAIDDAALPLGDKQGMLKDLGVLIKVGLHNNVACLVGIYEEPNLVTVAMEYYPKTLKELVLSSRALNNYPVYAEKEQRCSTLHEAQIIDIAAGIAKGMSYLQSIKVLHKRLSSRTVQICDGSIPKISMYGLDYYHPANEVYDFRRWTAPEALNSLHYVAKCEVWSFGVILWELATLGATPYADVKSKDIGLRVTRGMRLPQPVCAADELYQLMLQCWQVDLDERPDMTSLSALLDSMFNQALDHLSFNLFPGFQYEKYAAELEMDK